MEKGGGMKGGRYGEGSCTVALLMQSKRHFSAASGNVVSVNRNGEYVNIGRSLDLPW